MPEDHGFLSGETMGACIADVLDIAPVLAFEREHEEALA
jgi:hypothetical protein